MRPYFSLNKSRLKRLAPILEQVKALQATMRALEDQDFPLKTKLFKERLSKGESLDSLLPEAYALVREAAYRVLGLFPYDVQVLGAIVLHQGQIAEMKTGEGKTLTATMPLYLNALVGKGAFLVTPNAYLAKRGYEEMSPLYRFLGLSVSLGVRENGDQPKPDEKRSIYQADIHYTTNSSLGFDYLIDNLAASREDKFFPHCHFAIVDEIDAVLLDMAQTPLIISGSPRLKSNYYGLANDFISSLRENEDYHYDEESQSVWLKPAGIESAEAYFGLANLFDPQYADLFNHLVLALKAQKTLALDKDYVLEEDSVKLLDKTNGRILEGTKLQGGLHQALEEKEGVSRTDELRAVAGITYQSFFQLFKKLAGMTGTGKTAESELLATYNLPVVVIPTHRPLKRKDLPDQVFVSLAEKMQAILKLVRSLHQKGQPVLLITGSVKMSEVYSQYLLSEGIPHHLLNAFNAAREAQMISEAGQMGQVTLATNMAGRGTDIRLGEGVADLGGLAVIGTERMTSQRMDLQLRGRAGRQGDPGFSQFFVSLEDDLLTRYGPRWIKSYLETYQSQWKKEPAKSATNWRFRRLADKAQQVSDGQGRSSRELTQAFDESVRFQRDLVYQERNKLLSDQRMILDIRPLLWQALDQFLAEHQKLDKHLLERFIYDKISYSPIENLPTSYENDKIRTYLRSLVNHVMKEKREKFRHTGDFQEFLRLALLKAIDEAWIEEVDYLNQLRLLVSGRSLAQRNPIYEYHKEAQRAFEGMKRDILARALSYIMLSEISYTAEGELRIDFG